MKRSIIRVLSVLLVLAMCVSGMPLVLATGEGTGSGDTGAAFDPNAVTLELSGKEVAYTENPVPGVSCQLPAGVEADISYTVTEGSSLAADSDGNLRVQGLGVSKVAATLRFTYEGQSYEVASSNTAAITVVDAVRLVSDLNGSMTLSAGRMDTVLFRLSGYYTDVERTGYEATFGVAVTDDTVIAASVSNSGVVAVEGLKEGVSTVIVSATYEENGETVTVTDSFDVVLDTFLEITVTLKDAVSAFHFEQTGVFSSIQIGKATYNADWDLAGVLRLALPNSINDVFVAITGNDNRDSGTLSYGTDFSGGDGWLSEMQDVTFHKEGSGLTDLRFEASYNGDLVMYGTLKIVTPVSDIAYETDYATAVTLEEDDFDTFWDSGSSTGAILNYVVFDGQPRYGKLYTDGKKDTPVTKSMGFEYLHMLGSQFRDLDTVTYVPAEGKTTSYTDTVGFTAYGTDGTTLSGTLVITVSGADVITISSLGIAFGNANANLDDAIVAALKEETGKTLDYVTFDLLPVEDGVLFYEFETSLGSDRIAPEDRFHDTPSAKELSLAKVCFVPAAGRSGKVRIPYTAYATDKTSHSGYVTVQVQTKTKSTRFTDVHASSYSWAADAVDFLYYQQIVGGTNAAGTKYSPKNNITRGHFMLMLYRAFLSDAYGDYEVKENFADVAKGSTDTAKELYQAVGVAKYLGIARGANNKYNPNAPITREEAMTLIYRTLDTLKLDLTYRAGSKTDFKDWDKVASYAADAIRYFIDHGVVLGSGGKIQPKSNITRAEMAVILHRVLTY